MRQGPFFVFFLPGRGRPNEKDDELVALSPHDPPKYGCKGRVRAGGAVLTTMS